MLSTPSTKLDAVSYDILWPQKTKKKDFSNSSCVCVFWVFFFLGGGRRENGRESDGALLKNKSEQDITVFFTDQATFLYIWKYFKIVFKIEPIWKK